MNKVLLVDDHQLVRAGLKALIDSLEDFEVVAEANDGKNVAALVERYQPDVIITDLAMADKSGFDVITELKERHSSLPVIVLSMHASKSIVMRAIKAGAMAYLVKDSAEAELDLALQSVCNGQQYLSPKVSGLVLSALEEKEGGEKTGALLTPRQLEVLRLIALGMATKEIAYKLGLSAKTVETHRAQIMERLNIRDIAGLVRYALREGIIGLED